MPSATIDLEGERAALERARLAVADKLERLSHFEAKGHEAVTVEWAEMVVETAVRELRQDLVVFGRIDDDEPWRIGLYGVDDDAFDQLVVDWRAPFAERFYRAAFDEPMGLRRRVSYVGHIDDLFVEDFESGEVRGTSPLLAELSKSRGSTMRVAVATLQREQDELVRLAPGDRLVLRGGPGTGKTVVGLHRAAWLVYNDHRVMSEQILVLGPSDRYLRFVAAVLPTLGETRVKQTTFASLLGPSCEAGSDERWLPLLDALEASLLRPADVTVGKRVVPADEVAALVERFASRALPWRDRRRAFVGALVTRLEGTRYGEVSEAAKHVWPACTLKSAWAKVRNRRTLLSLGADTDLVDAWLRADGDGALHDEVRTRFEGVPARYSHVIVDEAQDLSLLQLRAVLRRGDGFTLVGDDAQRSNPNGMGLGRVSDLVGGRLAELRTAYRMSAEIATWLNEHARHHRLPALELVGIRPTGRPVHTTTDVEAAARALRERWPNVAVIAAGEVWDHKGVEYDAVVVDTAGMTPAEVYLAASRAAHELVIS